MKVTGVNNYNFNENTSVSEKRVNKVNDYSRYLSNKFPCLTPGKNVSVSVTGGLLKKAMKDPETGAWLERELAKAPDYISQAQKSASARGDRLLSATIEFGEEYSTMTTCTVTDTPGTDEDIDKWLEKIKEKKAKEKKAEEKRQGKRQVEIREENYFSKTIRVQNSEIEKFSEMIRDTDLNGVELKDELIGINVDYRA